MADDCFLHPTLPQLISNHRGAGGSGVGTACVRSKALRTILGALFHIWRPGIARGSDISCSPIQQEIVSFHGLPW